MPNNQKMITVRGFLVLNRRRVDRVTLKPPALAFGEVACSIAITLPEAVFTRPALNVSVRLDGPYEPSLSQEIRDDVDALLTDAGFTVRVEMPEASND